MGRLLEWKAGRRGASPAATGRPAESSRPAPLRTIVVGHPSPAAAVTSAANYAPGTICGIFRATPPHPAPGAALTSAAPPGEPPGTHGTQRDPGSREDGGMGIDTDLPQTTPDERHEDDYHLGMLGGFKRQLPDADPGETSEWIAALDDVVENSGRERADFLLRKVLKRARQLRIG